MWMVLFFINPSKQISALFQRTANFNTQKGEKGKFNDYLLYYALEENG